MVLPLTLAVAVFPPMALVGSLFDLWRSVGLYDTWPGLVIPYLSFALPLAMWTLTAFFRGLPWEMEQAAQADGATPWQAFRRVLVPLARPGVLTAAILVFFFAWNDVVSRSRSPRRTGPARCRRRWPSSPATSGSPSRSAASPPRPSWSPCR